MKTLITTLSSLLIFFCAFSQSTEEFEIRKLEVAQREAFLKKDTTALYKIFSPDFVVNAPTNKITTLQQLKFLIRNGDVDLENFEKVIEKYLLQKIFLL
jgi:hypothetical protein